LFPPFPLFFLLWKIRERYFPFFPLLRTMKVSLFFPFSLFLWPKRRFKLLSFPREGQEKIILAEKFPPSFLPLVPVKVYLVTLFSPRDCRSSFSREKRSIFFPSRGGEWFRFSPSHIHRLARTLPPLRGGGGGGFLLFLLFGSTLIFFHITSLPPLFFFSRRVGAPRS